MSDSPGEPAARHLGPRNILVPALVLMGLTFALHFRALGGYFLADDWINLRWFESPGQAAEIFVGNWMFGERMTPETPEAVQYLYRPIPRLSFLLDRAIWGLGAPAGHHVTNLVLHGLNITLLWGIAWTLLRSVPLAWAVAALFLMNPVTVEPAHWISARTDLWVGLFSLAAIWLTLAKAGQKEFHRSRFWSLALMQLALCSKETAAVLPLILLGIDLWRQRGWPRARVVWWGATLLLWLLHFLQRLWMFGAFTGHALGERYLSPMNHAGAVLGAGQLHLELFSLWGIFGVPVALLAVWALIRPASRPRLLFAAAWFVLSLLPLAAIGFSAEADTRLLYSAAAAWALALGAIFGSLRPQNPERSEIAVLGAWGVTFALILLVAPVAVFEALRSAEDWHRASHAARETVMIVADDLEEFPPEGLVMVGDLPERVGVAFVFRGADLPFALEMILEERGLDPPPIVSDLTAERSPDDARLMRPYGTDLEFTEPTAVIQFLGGEGGGHFERTDLPSGEAVEIGQLSVPRPFWE